MASDGQEAVGSLGNDAALAVLSDQPRVLYDYFKQVFAQVTNPPIDSDREKAVMSLESYIGPEKNLLEATPGHAHRFLLPHPILTNAQLAQLRDLNHKGFKSCVVDITFCRKSAGTPGEVLAATIERVCREVTTAIDEGCGLVILTDRGMGKERVPIPALLAVGGVHHHLVREGTRTRIGIALETGEAREVHHHALLIGYGADAINPYLAFESLWGLTRDGILPAKKLNDEKLVANYLQAIGKGLL
jgi:glutamate synthase (NADPH/NADH) large chain